MALGKSLGEVRALPAAELRKWQVFYFLEPWGWDNEEYLNSAVISAIVNSNRGKGRPVQATKFMRKPAKDLMEHLRKERRKIEGPIHDLSTPEGRKAAAEEMITNLKSVLGGQVTDKRRKDGNRSDN